MTISDTEREQWHNAADRAAERRAKQLAEAYGPDAVGDELRQTFRWLGANASEKHIAALIAAFDAIATDNFHDGYLDGLDSADLTEDERRAHEEDLGFDTYDD
jgi:hypothetical protein